VCCTLCSSGVLHQIETDCAAIQYEWSSPVAGRTAAACSGGNYGGIADHDANDLSERYRDRRVDVAVRCSTGSDQVAGRHVCCESTPGWRSRRSCTLRGCCYAQTQPERCAIRNPPCPPYLRRGRDAGAPWDRAEDDPTTSARVGCWVATWNSRCGGSRVLCCHAPAWWPRSPWFGSALNAERACVSIEAFADGFECGGVTTGLPVDAGDGA